MTFLDQSFDKRRSGVLILWLPILVVIIIVSALIMSCSGRRSDRHSDGNVPAVIDSVHHRSVYFWKTTFKIGPEEKSFLKRHGIDRIYLRMFDVDVSPDYSSDRMDVVPVATTVFDSAKPDGIEIVPAVFITVNALRHFENREDELASKIVKRVLNMCSYNDLGSICEVQFDCDWTKSSKQSYDRLCNAAKEILHNEGVLLSGTIRLHQIELAEYPFDKGVLMMYNTGAIKNLETDNSILAYADVKKYLGVKSRVKKFCAARKHNCRQVDISYPTFSWNAVFKRNGAFDRILSPVDLDSNPALTKKGNRYIVNEDCAVGNVRLTAGQTIRYEYPDIALIRKVRGLVDKKLGMASSNIIYHLDMANLSKYSDDEINEILR